jgi:hypothetical protein
MQTLLFNIATVVTLTILVLGPRIAELYFGTKDMER